MLSDRIVSAHRQLKTLFRITRLASLVFFASPLLLAENTLDILILYTQEIENDHGGQDGVQAEILQVYPRKAKAPRLNCYSDPML